MKKITFTIIFCLAFTMIQAQFKSSVPNKNIREAIIGKTAGPGLLNNQQIQIHHNFSMSMLNMGGTSIGIGAYTNSFSLALTPKMSLRTQISLVQPTMGGFQDNGSVFYGVGLDYKASENSFFSLQFNNYPTQYQRHIYQRPNQYFHLRGY